jgi:hypothetical protein
MRYDQPGTTNDGFTHTIIYGDGSFKELDAAMVEVSNQCEAHHRDFWISCWRGVRPLASSRFSGNPDARGIILRHYAHLDAQANSKQTWNSLYIAWELFADNCFNCEFFGNDCDRLLHITGDWAQNSKFPLGYKDEKYLARINPLGAIPGAPSPAIKTFGWYNPSAPLTSFSKFLQSKGIR